MKMKSAFAVLLTVMFSVAFVACKKGPKDEDLQKAAMEQMQSNPDLSGMSVMVKEGVATLSGECADETVCAACVSMVKAIPGIKDVVNTCTVKPPVVPEPEPPVVETVPMDAIQMAVNDALKDNPGITATVVDGEVTLTGEIAKTKLRGLMQTLQALNGVKKVNSASLTIK